MFKLVLYFMKKISFGLDAACFLIISAYCFVSFSLLGIKLVIQLFGMAGIRYPDIFGMAV